MVGGDGEGLQHFEVDLVGAVGVEQVRRHVAEAQALLDQAFGRAETRRDYGDGEAGIGQLREGDHLVGGMHGDADDVLRQRQLARHRRIGGDQAGHRVVGVDRAVLGQGLHGREPASAGDHGIGAGIGRSVHANDQVLQQAMGGDGGLHLGLGDRVCRRLAHVLGRKRQPVQGNLPDERFVQGCDAVHANLPRYGLEKDGTGAAETALSGRAAPALDRPGSASGRGTCGAWAAMAERRRPSPEASAGERPGVGAVTRAGCLVRGFGPVGGPVGGQIGTVRGLAERGRRLAHVAGSHREIGTQIGVGGPRYPEGEPGQGVECLPERFGRGAVYRPAHGAAPEEVPMSMRSPQGSRFQSPGGWA